LEDLKNLLVGLHGQIRSNDALCLRSAHPKRHIFEFRTNDLGTIGLWGDA
jgi:hypothetical protein